MHLNFEEKIRNIPDFPKKGIQFKDITPLLNDSRSFKAAIDAIVEHYAIQKFHFDKVVSTEARGFILGAALAYRLGAGFVPLRKPGKLPYKTIRHEFSKEYGSDAFEIHEDAVSEGESVLIVDDVLATGGTIQSAIHLTEKLGGNVLSICCLVELSFLNGRKKFAAYDFFSLIPLDE